MNKHVPAKKAGEAKGVAADIGNDSVVYNVDGGVSDAGNLAASNHSIDEEGFEEDDEEPDKDKNINGDGSNDSQGSINSQRSVGRPKHREQWSRVIDLTNDDLDDIRVYDLAPDLLMADAMKTITTRRDKLKPWKPLFWPEDYVKEGHSMKVEDNRLTANQLKSWAKKETQYRKHVRDKASQECKELAEDKANEYLRQTEQLSRRMHKGYFPKQKEVEVAREASQTKRQRW